MTNTLTSTICKLVAFNDNIIYRRQLYAHSPFYFTTQPIIDNMFTLSYWKDFFERELTAIPGTTSFQLLSAIPAVMSTTRIFPLEFKNIWLNDDMDTSPENMLYIELIFKDWRVAGAGVKPVFESYGSHQTVRLGNTILDLIKEYATQTSFSVLELAQKIYNVVDPNHNDPDLMDFMKAIVNHYGMKTGVGCLLEYQARHPTYLYCHASANKYPLVSLVCDMLNPVEHNDLTRKYRDIIINSAQRLPVMSHVDPVKPVEITPTLVTDPIKQESKRLRSGKKY